MTDKTRYAHGLDIPDSVFECASIKEIERIGIDFVIMLVPARENL